MPFRSSPRTFPLAAAAIFGAAVFSEHDAVRADPADRLREGLQNRAGSCGAAGSGSLSDGARCLLGGGLTLLIDEGVRLARDRANEAFGARFEMTGRPGFSPVADGFGLTGDLDAIVPLAGAEPSAAEQPSGSALFLQQGVTRWQDDSGSHRSDLRYGPVYRFRVSGGPGADIVGLSLLQQHSAGREHRVLVPGIDYSGRWGTGSFRYFSPKTGWRANRRGHDERALAGMETSARLDLTSALGMHAAGYRWESRTGSGRWDDGVRLGLGWQPHPWLQMGASYDRSEGGGGEFSFRIGFRMPLGDPARLPRWRGLGVAAGGTAPGDSELWRPVEGDGRIRTGSREGVPGLVDGAEVRFLQGSVESGGTLRLEVLLSSAAPEDIRVEVRLVPGDGDNPAVPGEDFVDEPVTLTIPEGAVSGTVSVQLLRNAGQRENRSLSATVDLVS